MFLRGVDAVYKRAMMLVLVLLAAGLPAAAQVQIGDEINLRMAGDVSFGYDGSYASLTPSEHGFAGGGDLNLSGSYYNPSFLSFNVQPFYNESRNNSSYQSITDSSGASANVSLFSGSHFPGSINYTKNYDSEGQFAVPGLSDIVTHGNDDSLSLNWGVNLPDAPSLAVGFTKGSNAYSLYGANANGTSHYDSFTIGSAYQLAGFNLNANYHYTTANSVSPQLFGPDTTQLSSSGGDTFSFGVGHKLPLNGSVSATASRSDVSASVNGAQDYSGTIDTVSGGVGFIPFKNLTVGTNTVYTDNLTGTLFQGLLASGAVLPLTNQSSRSMDMTGFANYQIPVLHLTFTGSTEHRDQSLFGSAISSNSSTGTVSYANSLLGGFVTALAGATETSADTFGHQNTVGLITSLGYSRSFGAWDVAGSGNYTQSQQTALAGITNSSYGYSGTIGRKFSRSMHWGVSGSASKSGLDGVAGSSNFSQSYSTVFSTRYYSVSGSYAKSSGNSILTTSGLAPSPIPVTVLLPSAVVFYGGKSYSIGLGATPIRRLTISATYSKALSDTLSSSLTSNNSTEQMNIQTQYFFRKMSFRAGYSKLLQGLSLPGTPPSMVGSLYIGVSRWFNFF